MGGVDSAGALAQMNIRNRERSGIDDAYVASYFITDIDARAGRGRQRLLVSGLFRCRLRTSQKNGRNANR